MKNEIQANANTGIFGSGSVDNYIRFADLMASSAVMLPAHLSGKPADCMAVAIQAAAWGMNPFAVAQKTHVVNGTLGYEAQLVNAVISSSSAIVGRFHYRTIGDWSKWKYQAKKITKGGKNGNYTVETHGGLNESGLGIQVGAQLAGDSDITWDDVLYLENIEIRNSPLWKSRPLQQIKYLGVKYWGRIYCPEVILGVYTPDELVTEEKEINPIRRDSVDADKIGINDVLNGEPEKNEGEISLDDLIEDSDEFTPLSKFEELRDLFFECETVEDINHVSEAVKQAVENGELDNQQIEILRKTRSSAFDAVQ